MGEVRACVYLLVSLVIFQRTLASPSFGTTLWCSLFCDDYDEDDDSGVGFDDILTYLLDPCGDCETKPSVPTSATSGAINSPADTPSEAVPGAKPQKINLSIPPANGVNLTLENSGTWWWLNLIPWVGGGSATTVAPAAASTTPATSATPAGNDTAANATTA